jgi:hypothetical protein
MRAEPRIEATRDIRTLPIAELPAEAMKRTATESSVSSLFE